MPNHPPGEYMDGLLFARVRQQSQGPHVVNIYVHVQAVSSTNEKPPQPHFIIPFFFSLDSVTKRVIGNYNFCRSYFLLDSFRALVHFPSCPPWSFIRDSIISFVHVKRIEQGIYSREREMGMDRQKQMSLYTFGCVERKPFPQQQFRPFFPPHLDNNLTE